MSDTWIEVTIETTTEAVEAITNILYEKSRWISTKNFVRKNCDKEPDAPPR